MLRIKKFMLSMLLLVSGLVILPVQAASPHVFEHSVARPMDEVYNSVYKGLESEGFWVVFEVDISRNISRFAEKWGENYNRNKLDSIRGMVFCNGWYANAVSNADPSLLALCPLRITLIEKQGKTTALFARPTAIAGDSPAQDILQRIEDEVIMVVKKSM